MKIFHLSSEYPPQKVFGLGRFVHDISVEMARQGHEVHVITNSMSGKDFEIEENQVHIHRVHFPPPPKPGDATTTVIQFNTQIIERAVPLIKNIGCDIINTHDWLTFLAGNSLKKIFGMPHVLTIHDTMIGKKFGKLGNPERLAANVEKYGCCKAEITICCSEFIKDELIKKYEAPEKEIRVIPCAVEEKRFWSFEEEFLKESFRRVLAEPEEILVTYIGRLDEEKGLEVLLNAIPEVLQENDKVRFVLAGKGVMEDSIQNWVNQNKWGDRIKLPGYVQGKTVSYLYKVSDIQVIPSRYEPFGIVALEGMINGCAVVASKTGGLAEIVESGRDGTLFSSGDSKELAKAILFLADNQEKRKEIAARGYEKAKDKYNWERITRLTLDVYKEAGQKKDEKKEASKILEIPEGKTWILLVGKGEKKSMKETVESIEMNTRAEYEIIAIESEPEKERAGQLMELLRQGKISRVIMNKRGTVPNKGKGYEITQAVQILSEELLDWFCWMDCSVKVKAGWLELALKILKEGKAEVVALEKEAASEGKVWIIKREFFVKFGLPPIGLEKEAGIEEWHYMHKLEEKKSKMAVLQGWIE
ncbi:MAG: glycosyltransferase [Candidatus Brocadiae bacterium]|nr:glycosyltransferase [Candidatus Brocadiia bacterium]